MILRMLIEVQTIQRIKEQRQKDRSFLVHDLSPGL
jgi:hypothetical protein